MPNRRIGYNGSMSTRGYGTRDIRCFQLDFGVTVIATSVEAARRRSFYSVKTAASSFRIGLEWVTYEEREDFNRWIRRFMVAVSTGQAKHGAMTIRVPSRDFLRIAVPQGPLDYGEGWDDVTYRSTLSFVGATDPHDIEKQMHGPSTFLMPKDRAETKFFYPAGRQIAGAESLDGTIFDTTPSGAPFVQEPDNLYEGPTGDELLEHHGEDPVL